MEKKSRFFVIAHMGAEYRKKNLKKHTQVETLLREMLKIRHPSALESVVELMTGIEVRAFA
jgi:hypothetical protein